LELYPPVGVTIGEAGVGGVQGDTCAGVTTYSAVKKFGARIHEGPVVVIGAGGLGTLIIRAIGQSSMMKLLVGAVLVSVLAIVADLLLQMLQRALTPKGVQKT